MPRHENSSFVTRGRIGLQNFGKVAPRHCQGMDAWLILPALRGRLCGDLLRTTEYPDEWNGSSLELRHFSILSGQRKPCILLAERLACRVCAGGPNVYRHQSIPGVRVQRLPLASAWHSLSPEVVPENRPGILHSSGSKAALSCGSRLFPLFLTGSTGRSAASSSKSNGLPLATIGKFICIHREFKTWPVCGPSMAPPRAERAPL